MIGVYVAAGLAVLLVVAIVVSYNRFAAQRAAIDASWAGIAAELQRLHDLVPNLVAAVKGYARHERDVLERVVAARTAAVAADRDPAVGPGEQARAEDALSGALRRLFALAEGYPELKASDNFRDLQAQLTETEDRIAAARRLYNIEVAQHNRRTRAFPSNLVASGFGFTPRDYFEVHDDSARRAPQVSF